MSTLEVLCDSFEKEKFTTKSYDADEYVIETFLLDGKYTIKMDYLNIVAAAMYEKDGEKDDVYFDDYFERAECCKAVYVCGNILYKTDEPKILEYINLIIAATYTDKLPVKVDKNVRKREQVFSGDGVCPTRDVIFAYDGKLFILYGRYIYGYDQKHVRFVNVNPKNAKEICEEYSSSSSSSSDDEEVEEVVMKKYDDGSGSDFEPYYEDYEEEKALPPSLCNKEVILPVVPYDTKCKLRDWLDDYNYSFSIIDIKTNVLNAFALYR